MRRRLNLKVLLRAPGGDRGLDNSSSVHVQSLHALLIGGYSGYTSLQDNAVLATNNMRIRRCEAIAGVEPLVVFCFLGGPLLQQQLNWVYY
jgi:hypothetical protein